MFPILADFSKNLKREAHDVISMTYTCILKQFEIYWKSEFFLKDIFIIGKITTGKISQKWKLAV